MPSAATRPCPLCGGTAARRRDFSTDAISTLWFQRFGFDISDEVAHVDRITAYACTQCDLVHFDPPAIGSEAVYQGLQQFEWYYTEDKWEHREAILDIPPGAHVLEVGCGLGGFLDVVQERRGARASGIDVSTAAVRIARDRGRAVTVADVQIAAARQPRHFDVVCAFQVLEHVEDPKAFLRACVALLKPGGRLCIGVPNNDGYLGCQRFEDASLNLPPHHATRWGVRTLRALETVFPLTLRRLRCESLLSQHAPEFITVNLDAHWLLRGGLQRQLVGRVGSLALTRFGLRKLVRGHTVYASFTRRADGYDTLATTSPAPGRALAFEATGRRQTP